MKFEYNYMMHRGWDIEQFEVNGETHYRAVKNGTTIANADLEVLIDILDELDFPPNLRYTN